MGLKILTSVKLFLYGCQNKVWTLPDPSSPGFRAIHGPGGSSARVTANEAEATRRNETEVP
jgi:hypothetical protein